MENMGNDFTKYSEISLTKCNLLLLLVFAKVASLSTSKKQLHKHFR